MDKNFELNYILKWVNSWIVDFDTGNLYKVVMYRHFNQSLFYQTDETTRIDFNNEIDVPVFNELGEQTGWRKEIIPTHAMVATPPKEVKIKDLIEIRSGVYMIKK